jgi:tripeptide aminopeptidase
MSTLLDRFCRYARVNTQADEKSSSVPTTPGPLELGRVLRDELREGRTISRRESP